MMNDQKKNDPPDPPPNSEDMSNPHGSHQEAPVVTKMTKTEKKKLEKAIAAERVRACLERKASGENIRPRIKYEKTDRTSRAAHVPNPDQAGNTKKFEKGNKIKISTNCNIYEALSTFTTGVLLEWEQYRIGDSDTTKDNATSLPQRRAANIQTKDDDDTPFMVILPSWVSTVRDELNKSPFQRSLVESNKVHLYNTGWQNWIFHQCAVSVNEFFAQNSQQDSNGDLKFVNLKESLDNTSGAISILAGKLKGPNIGPLLPLPSLPEPLSIESPSLNVTQNSNSHQINSEAQEVGQDNSSIHDSSSSLDTSISKSVNTTSKSKLTPILSPSPIKRHVIPTAKDSPFNLIYGQPSTAQFGKLTSTDKVIYNSDMESLLPGNLITTNMCNIFGEIMSYGKQFHFITSREIVDALQTQDIIKRDLTRTKLSRMLLNKDGSANVNLVATYFSIGKQGYVIVSDTTSHITQVYHPSYDGGIITKTSETEVLCNGLVNLGKLYAFLLREKPDLWIPNPQTWTRTRTPSYLEGPVPQQTTRNDNDIDYSIHLSMYNMMFIASLGLGTSHVLSNQDLEQFKKQGQKYGWDLLRGRYFTYITNFLRKKGILYPQPRSFTEMLSGETSSSNQSDKLKKKTVIVQQNQEPSPSSNVGNEPPTLAKAVETPKDPITETIDIETDAQSEVNQPVVIRNVTIMQLSQIAKMNTKQLERIAGKITSPNSEILFKDFRTLLPGKWLNDSIILAIISTIHKRSISMNDTRSFVFTDSLNTQRAIRGDIRKPNSGRPNSIFELVRKIIRYKLLILPYNYAESHWLLFIVDFDNRKVVAYNPYNHDGDDISEEPVREALRRIAACVTTVMKEILDKNRENSNPIFIPTFTYISDSRISTQTNDGWNCGVFILSFLELFINSTDYDKENCDKMGSADQSIKATGSNALRNRYYFQVMDALIMK